MLLLLMLLPQLLLLLLLLLLHLLLLLLLLLLLQLLLLLHLLLRGACGLTPQDHLLLLRLLRLLLLQWGLQRLRNKPPSPKPRCFTTTSSTTGCSFESWLIIKGRRQR